MLTCESLIYEFTNALVQHMTDFCLIVSMSRLFETLIGSMFCHRTAQYTMLLPLVATPYIACTVLLSFSLFEAVKNQSYIKLEPLQINELTN